MRIVQCEEAAEIQRLIEAGFSNPGEALRYAVLCGDRASESYDFALTCLENNEHPLRVMFVFGSASFWRRLQNIAMHDCWALQKVARGGSRREWDQGKYWLPGLPHPHCQYCCGLTYEKV